MPDVLDPKYSARLSAQAIEAVRVWQYWGTLRAERELGIFGFARPESSLGGADARVQRSSQAIAGDEGLTVH